MSVLQSLRRRFRRRTEDATAAAAAGVGPTRVVDIDLDLAPNDPLVPYLLQAGRPVELASLELESPALQQLREAGIVMTVPLISQRELVGLINLGRRMSEQDYSSDDRRLLRDLASQAAPALRVAQLVVEQQQEAAERERIAQELRVARIIQQTMLPEEVPHLEGWHVAAYYRPAREVGGDFYDFIHFPDGRVGFIVADVTDKGVPAAMVMATTRSILRAAAERLEDPGAVLERTNEVLHSEIPPRMFVTCFYALLDPATGYLRYANAGHDVPYRYTHEGVVELRARGMPLGLMPGMAYEEKESTLQPGEYVLLYSDGLVEAHNAQGEMFGFPRLQRLLAPHDDGSSLTDYLLDRLAAFTGAGWEQEDDVTLVTLQRTPGERAWRIASAPGNEHEAVARVMAQLEEAGVALPSRRLERLKTAVAEATMNAMEHGNDFDPGRPVRVAVEIGSNVVTVRISDEGSGPPPGEAEPPDVEAKVAGEQSPRGWGLFLIQNMVDEINVIRTENSHTVELVVYLNGERGESNGAG